MSCACKFAYLLRWESEKAAGLDWSSHPRRVSAAYRPSPSEPGHAVDEPPSKGPRIRRSTTYNHGPFGDGPPIADATTDGLQQRAGGGVWTAVNLYTVMCLEERRARPTRGAGAAPSAGEAVCHNQSTSMRGPDTSGQRSSVACLIRLWAACWPQARSGREFGDWVAENKGGLPTVVEAASNGRVPACTSSARGPGATTRNPLEPG